MSTCSPSTRVCGLLSSLVLLTLLLSSMPSTASFDNHAGFVLEGSVPLGGEWTTMNPATSPSLRMSHAMAYDSKSDRVILFGGYVAYECGWYFCRGPWSDTWAYDYDVNTWTNMSPAENPSGRGDHAMVFDSQSEKVILFGGRSGNRYLGDTWVYDFAANTWTNMSPRNSPSPRGGHAMVYDSQTDRVILFGGYAGSTFDSDTWSYDYRSNRWTNLSPPSGPPGRYGHAMAYDSGSDRVILFGGNTGGFDGDTWSYDYRSNRWTNLKPPSGPPGRYGHAMAYDSGSDRVILFGGFLGYAPRESADTWSYNAGVNTWGNLIPRVRPSARSDHAVAYDSQSDRVILFGGSVADWVPQPDDTWSYRYSANFPGAPTMAQPASGDTRIKVRWQPPASDGGSPVTNYSIYRGTVSHMESYLTTVGNVPTFTDTGLANGVTYYYDVSAVNAAGEGPRSIEVSATPSAGASENNPVFVRQGIVVPLGYPVGWDGYRVGGPSVLLEGAIYKMWYFGCPWDWTCSIGYATSTDGRSWAKQGPVLTPSLPAEGIKVMYPSVVEVHHWYWMWYNGWDGSKWTLLAAKSKDGVSWIKQGEVFAVGSSGFSERFAAVVPDVLFDDHVFKMYYVGSASALDGTGAISLATSHDGMNWTRAGVVLDDSYQPTGFPSVLRRGSAYDMAYTVKDYFGATSILTATSQDGVHWHGNGVALAPLSPNEIVQQSPCLAELADGAIYLYYGASIGLKYAGLKDLQIYLAVAEPPVW